MLYMKHGNSYNMISIFVTSRVYKIWTMTSMHLFPSSVLSIFHKSVHIFMIYVPRVLKKDYNFEINH